MGPQSPHPFALSTERGFERVEVVISCARKTWLFLRFFLDDVLVWQIWPIPELLESRSSLTVALYFQYEEGSGL